MTLKELIGNYAITGNNQGDAKNGYEGVLTLTLDANRIIANWLINNEQEQSGIGFFKNNILVINFHYIGEDKLKYTGTVVYQCMTKDVLEGFWSEEHGNPAYLGIESCIRLKTTEVLN